MAVPTGECKPASTWVKADRLQSLIPRETESSAKLDRSCGAVAREFSSPKHEWALLPLRVRGPATVRLHADLTILAKLACAVAIARDVRVAAYPRLDRIPRRPALVRALVACGSNAGLLKRRREPFASTISLTTDALVVPAFSGLHRRQP